MQALYAFKQAEKSDYSLALDRITETFSPNLNSMQVQNAKQLEGNRQLATLLFEENHRQPDAEFGDESASPEVLVTVANAISFYHHQVRKDGQSFAKAMLAEAERIYDHYLLILLIPVELADMARQEADDRKNKYLNAYPASPGDLNLYNNGVIRSLRESKPLETERIRRGLSWDPERNLLRKVYRDVLENDPVYQQYVRTAEVLPAEDRKMVPYLFKNLVFEQELLHTYFEEADLNWTENGEIIKGMLSKTVKTAAGEGSTVNLLALSTNWEDDREFFIQLYQSTVENDEKYEQLIVEKVENWDPERVAMLDKILLKMAISEMMIFPGIPVKVTINEYIELSKLYSTPKSKQFINGVLDVIALELVNSGAVRKSGRGLVDNK
ncbi:MAG: transcription antitermination factor NusB [Ferruginibacter sp.]|nr:transcription antitermination factor NusB [Cytophagales bacterium]